MDKNTVLRIQNRSLTRVTVQKDIKIAVCEVLCISYILLRASKCKNSFSIIETSNYKTISNFSIMKKASVSIFILSMVGLAYSDVQAQRFQEEDIVINGGLGVGTTFRTAGVGLSSGVELNMLSLTCGVYYIWLRSAGY